MAIKNLGKVVPQKGVDYFTEQDIKSLNIPTKTSQLTNDSNFITSIPSEYITETELNKAISNVSGGVSSDIINSIMVVDELPETELEGVLYLVKEIEVDVEEPTNEYVTNPTMEMGSISRDGNLSDSTTSCRTSDYVYVYGKSKITITNGLGSTTRVLCYDENKNFMTNWFVDGSTTYSYRQVAEGDNMSIPNGCHYIKAKVDSETIITLTIGYTD